VWGEALSFRHWVESRRDNLICESFCVDSRQPIGINSIFYDHGLFNFNYVMVRIGTGTSVN
jgi:hypothetical protein